MLPGKPDGHCKLQIQGDELTSASGVRECHLAHRLHSGAINRRCSRTSGDRMRTIRVRIALAVFVALSFASGNAWAKSPDQEYWDAARKASCPELIDAFNETTAAERKVSAAIKESKDGTVAT